MESVVLVSVVLFAAFLALWPVAFFLAVVRHFIHKQWRRVAQVALLLPIWSIPASVGLIQVTRLTAALEAPQPSSAWVMPATAIGLSLCCGVLAWALLLRSFGGASSAGERRQPL